MAKTAYLSSAYLAPIEYYRVFYRYEKVYVEQYDHYAKQTYRNRCVISGPNGRLTLSIPTVKPDTAKVFMKDVRISDHGNWRHLHWNALESAYGNTPFFDYYRDDIEPFYRKKYNFLIDFNEELIYTVGNLLDLSLSIERTAVYQLQVQADEKDYREVIHPKRQHGIDTGFEVRPYYQLFEEKMGFTPNLSIVDLLFNMGPESILYL